MPRTGVWAGMHKSLIYRFDMYIYIYMYICVYVCEMHICILVHGHIYFVSLCNPSRGAHHGKVSLKHIAYCGPAAYCDPAAYYGPVAYCGPTAYLRPRRVLPPRRVLRLCRIQ